MNDNSGNIDREKYEEYVRAKVTLAKLGYVSISDRHYQSLQNRILFLEEELAKIHKVLDKILETGLNLMFKINKAITYNDQLGETGYFALPKAVIDEMNKFTQSLHDLYDSRLPLVKD